MKKQLLLMVLLAFLCVESYSQITFEKGYFIDESNKRVDCYIKNVDWRSNPTKFEYMLSLNDVTQVATVETVKEFGINDFSKYVRAKVYIDRSSDQIEYMSSERNPIFNEELLFLKVLIEGSASLYQYTDGSLNRFFYELNNSGISQLVNKKYLRDGKMLVNSSFKQELLLNMKCDKITSKEIKNLRYSNRDLEKLFTKYNECIGLDYVNLNPNKNKDLFYLNIRPGLNYGNLEVRTSTSISNFLNNEFGYKLGFRIGVEAEFILPFNNNIWAVIVEPTYQYYKSEVAKKSNLISSEYLIAEVDYKSIELPIGVRRYFHLNDKSKLFANISYVIDYPINSHIKYFRNSDGEVFYNLDIRAKRKLALGVGYKYNDKFSSEIRYYTKRNLLNGYFDFMSDYSSISLIIGYTIF